MSYRIAIYRETEKMLDGLDRTTARRIEAKIEELAQDPFSPACPDR
jgi:mRNA-degrading endonuclease RelE of RelBE toxin-antitoxin system